MLDFNGVGILHNAHPREIAYVSEQGNASMRLTRDGHVMVIEWHADLHAWAVWVGDTSIYADH